MADRTARYLTDRDLRALTTEELLALIQADIKELDGRIKARPKPERKAARTASIQEAMASLSEEPPPEPFHAITCCNNYMGDFPPAARVRCPFCGEWHKAADFPVQA